MNNNVTSLSDYRAKRLAETESPEGDEWLLGKPPGYYEHEQLGRLDEWDDELHHFVLTRLSELYTDPNYEGRAEWCLATGMMMMATCCLFEEQRKAIPSLFAELHEAAIYLQSSGYGEIKDAEADALEEIAAAVQKYWARQDPAKDN